MDPFSQNAVDTLAQDFDSFENMSFDPYSIDPMNDNQRIDWTYLERILNDDMRINDMTVEEAHYVVGDEGGAIQTVAVTNQMSNGSSVVSNSLLNAGPQVGENVKKWVTRKRYKKGFEEAARIREENKIKNRIAAAISCEKKKAHIHDLQLKIQKLKKANAYLTWFLKANSKVDTNRKQLQRTASGPI